MRHSTPLIVVLSLAFLAWGCGGSSKGNPDGSPLQDSGSGDAAADTDADGDGDTDSDTDTDTDADGDSNWVLIEVSPSTTFNMGSPTWELGRGTDETQHSVTLTIDFEIMTHEVTQAEFQALMTYNPSYYDTECGADCPVEQVSWHEALEYANRLSTQKGLARCFDCTGTQPDFTCALKAEYAKPQDCPGYRLPTEAEWEYAARAKNSTAFYPSPGNDGNITNVDSDPNLDQIGWYVFNSSGRTHPKMRKEANAWGLYDMSGNVWEWVWDWYRDYPGSVTDPAGAGADTIQVIRGGSWYSDAVDCRSAERSFVDPTSRGDVYGFRLVRSN